MAPSLLWTDTGELARLARFPSTPAPAAGVARFPTGMQPAPPLPAHPDLDPRKTPFVPVLNPALTPTRVAMPEIESARQQTLNSAAVQGASAPPTARPVTVWTAAKAPPPPRPPGVPAVAARAPVVPQVAPAPPQRAVVAPAPRAPPAAGPQSVVAPRAAAPVAAPSPSAVPTRVQAAVSRTAPQARSLADLAAVPAQLKAEPRPAVPLTNSAAWQRPSFKSVELNVEGLNLDAMPSAPAASRSSAVMAAGIAAIAEGIAHEPPPVPGPLEPRGELEESLSNYLARVMRETGAVGAFVADADGLELANALATPDLVAVSSLMGAHVDELRRVLHTEGDGSLTFELDADTLLQVLWANTALGRLAVGLVASASLAPEAARRVRSGLVVAARALKPESVF